MPKSIESFKFSIAHLGKTYTVEGKETTIGPMLRMWAKIPGAVMYLQMPPDVLYEIARELDTFRQQELEAVTEKNDAT
jgi:hypothetical protein